MAAFPLSLPPSEYWRGNDGRWSTFLIEVGTPGQPVELLPATSATAGNSIWVVIPQGCTQANPNLTDCEDQRGQLFRSNQSTTWSTSRLANNGLYNLPTYQESMLGLSGNAYYGFDTIKLNWRLGNTVHNAWPVWKHQLIAGIATKDFWLGSLGLSPIAFNFTSLNDPVPSLLGSLAQNDYGWTPSLSWAYTAGMPYREPPVYGSLTFGGYDTSRSSSQNSVSIPFGTDSSRDLLVGLQSIVYDTLGSTPLLSSGIYAFIDSMVAQMWLPFSVCKAFEQAFNLTWNATAELYLVTAAQHASLLAQNPTFTFTVGTSAAGGKTADIVLPYAAFDLSVSEPIVNPKTRYFPLKRASNSSQYTLGRVFLQEAYVVADYDRRNFSVSQALAPGRNTQSNIVNILHPGTQMTKHHGNGDTGLSTGALAGIITGGIVGLIVIIAATVWFWKRWFRHEWAKGNTPDPRCLSAESFSRRLCEPTHPAEMSAIDHAIFEPNSRVAYPPELDGGCKPKCSSRLYELSDRRSIAELEAPNARLF